MLDYVLISLIFQMLGFLLLSLKACLDIDSLNLKLVCRTYRVWLMQNISVEGNQSKWLQWYFVSSSQTTCCCVSDLNCDFIYISFMALICVNRFQFDWSATKYHTNRYYFTGIHTLVDFDWYKLCFERIKIYWFVIEFIIIQIKSEKRFIWGISLFVRETCFVF